ncbi:hypothetical protein AB1Y20_010164 [Prymnesium parvum]|uniref:Mitogen-activated protein kinase n=1 Tax=Prymnesium parvum TaxID=97485 RepID=A0AB34K7K6_PRYPA
MTARSENVAPNVDTVPTHSVPTNTLTSSVRGTDFTIDARYRINKFVGCGSYGVVCAALDTRDQSMCAIKKICNVFKNDTTAKRTLREIKLLLHFDHENVISIRDMMTSGADCADLYVVTALMDTDLHKVIRSPQPLSDQHVQYFLYQLLRGLKYLHSCNVLHRDLKPSNLLVNENCDLKITDFGLSRGVNPSDCLDFLTEYVVTRWYRAPEIVLSSDTYTKAVDLWSCGCIFAELLGRKPIFPGSDHVQQLSCILDVLGTPNPEHIHHVPEKARRYIAGLQPSAGKELRTMYPNASEEAVSLLYAMLHWDPAQRCTVSQALSHPYLAAFHNPAAEPVAEAPFDFEVEACNHERGSEDAREALFKIACRFRPELEGTRAPRLSNVENKGKRSRNLGSESACSTGCTSSLAPGVPNESTNWPRYGGNGGAAQGRTATVTPTPRQTAQPSRVRQQG